VASFDNPGGVAAAVGHLTDWGRAQAALLRVPDRAAEAALRATPADAAERVDAIFGAVAAEGRHMLPEPEAKAALAAYGVPVPETRVAQAPVEVGDIASDMLRGGGKLVVKVLSRDITHKSDVGGVVLGIETPAAAQDAAHGIEERVLAAAPEARIDGFALQPMIRRPGALELILGVHRVPVFGPVILFGAGGTAVELLRDTAIALPPLDAGLAADLVAQTRIGRLLAGYRDRPPADAGAIHGALIALSHLIEDFPCLRAIDVNPLLADAEGAVALDARIEIDPGDLARTGPNPDLAIRPYPAAWRRELAREDGVYAMRPILPADALLYPEFLAHTDANDIRLRFLAPRKHFPEEWALRLTQLDYDRDMAFVALTPSGELAGAVRISCDPDHTSGEYALIVRSDLQGRGLGSALMALMLDYARADGLERLEGPILAENAHMLGLVRRFGFELEINPEDPGLLMSRLALG
jgi:acetyltransferase